MLLLNTVLTVRAGQPNSHKDKGWEIFTDRVISELDRKETPVVFLLWGANAEKKARVITNPIHKKLITVHPSPLSAYRGFFGAAIFQRRINTFGKRARSRSNGMSFNFRYLYRKPAQYKTGLSQERKNRERQPIMFVNC